MAIKVSKQRWQSIQVILDDVLDMPQAQQTDYLKKQCANDSALYDDIKALLDAEREAPEFLDKPAHELAQTLFDDVSIEASKDSREAPALDLKGAQIGAYQLCEEIGRGGMGAVYRAERRQGDFEQQVAIKLLWNWKDRDSIIERFQREQQLLASLSHPNIAQLYDGGLTEEGQPYFVMEYVQGEPIDRYCNVRRLGIDARLRLVLQVVEALSFAHKHLIVHRDIKPSNIFVTNEGQVKLLDFGIAKWLNEQEDLELTRTGEQLLTPGFAAPEQLQNKAITVATDVYQLGLVVYELLTGRQAFRDQADSFMALVQVMCQQAPTRPSVIVSQEVANDKNCDNIGIAALSECRGLTVKQLQKKLQGDLDAIVGKMLQSAASDRYMSMELFRLDLDAYFARRPIVARKQSLFYNTKKFAQRHWRAVSILSVFVLMLAVYAVTVTQQIEKTRQALNQSILEKSKAQQVSDFLVNVFKAADPNVSGLQTITAQSLLDKGQTRIIKELNDVPEVQAHMLTLLGEIYFSQGIYNNSVQLLEDSLARQRLYVESNGFDFANTLTQLGIVYIYMGRFKEAGPLLEESLSLHEKSATQGVIFNKLEYAEALSAYGQLLYYQGDYARATRNILRAIDILEKNGYGEHEELATALNNLASAQHTQGEFELAGQNMRRAIDIQKKVLGEEHSYYAVHLANFGIMLTDMERYEEAEALLRYALSLQKKILGDVHPYVADTLRSLGVLLHRQGRLDEAETYLRNNIQLENADKEKDYISIAITQMWLGEVLQDGQKFSEAQSVYDEMMLVFRDKIKTGSVMGRALGQLASLAYLQKNYVQASEIYQQALSEIPPDNIRVTYAQVGYAQVLLELNDWDAAENLLNSALALRQKAFPLEHSKVAEVQALLGVVLARKGMDRQALELLGNAVAKLEQTVLFQYGTRNRLLMLSRSALAELNAK